MPKDYFRRRSDPDTGNAAPLRALVVDDHDQYRGYVARLMAESGFEVTACAGGTDAIVAVSANPNYSILVIDCEMPGMSGMSLMAALRSHEMLADVYAVMLSAREDVETKISALRLGFDDYVSKAAGEMEIRAKLSAARRLVSRQKRLDETVRELYALATHDELTGLFNRRFFFSEAERLLEAGATVNLVFFDLDSFKWVNDTFGHLAGDQILRDVGSLFLCRTRSEDLISRYGGDEFVMLVQTLAPPEVEGLAARMADEIARQRWTFGADSFGIGVTTGVACSSLLHQPTIAQLLSAGDRDLYKNKWLRKNPDVDPALYEYDRAREGRVVEIGK